MKHMLNLEGHFLNEDPLLLFKMKNGGLHSCLLWPSESFAVVELSVGFIILRIIKDILLLCFAKYISMAHIFIFLFIFKALGYESPEWFRKFNTF